MKTSNKILLAAGVVPVLLCLAMVIAFNMELKHYMDETPSQRSPASTSEPARPLPDLPPEPVR